MPNLIANKFMQTMIASPLHPLLGGGFAVITVTGRKTGRRISTPINVSPQGTEFTVVSTRNRNWWKNLRDGKKGELRYQGKTISVTARIVDQASEVPAELKAFFGRYPGHAKYFGVRMDDHGSPLEEDLTRAAKDRVIIFLLTVPSG
jgi:deazaflavin-dependent oxidoreductase (nitroreductase family)